MVFFYVVWVFCGDLVTILRKIYLLQKVIGLFAGAFLVSITGSIIDFVKFLHQLSQVKGVVQAFCVQILKLFQAGCDVLKSEFHLWQLYISVLYLEVYNANEFTDIIYFKNESTV